MEKKKCVKCGAPLEGFMAKISRLFGVKPSETNPDCCNKCEKQATAVSQASDQDKPEEMQELVQETPAKSVEKPAETPSAEPTAEPASESPAKEIAETDEKEPQL